MIRAALVIACLMLTLAMNPPAASAQVLPPAAEISNLRLFSSFWMNLHHFLYASAWARRPADRGQRRGAMPLPAGSEITLPDEERIAWESAVSYYDRELASKDLLFDRGMTAINAALAAAAETVAPTDLSPDHQRVLEGAAAVYRRHWWPEHDAANRTWIAEAARRTTLVAVPIIDRLTHLYDVGWFQSAVRVDVVRVGKSLGAYTAVEPRVHIVVASADRSYADWAATEMLFHESSHALIDNVRQAIDHAAKVTRKNPRDLWHVVLFYVAGEVTRQTLAARGIEYQPYLYATGLFDLAWQAFRAPIERYVRAFVDGQSNMTDMASNLVSALP